MLGRNTRRWLAAIGMLWLAPTSGALAQTVSDPIVVTAARPEQTQSFVEQLAVAGPMADQLPRWDSAICTSVAGMPQRQAQFLADRIAQRAMSVGLQPGGPGCRANVAVFVTADSDEFARTLFEQDRSLFAYLQEDNVTTLGQDALNDFLNTPRAVRWWHVAETFGADGISLAGDASQGGMDNAPVARSTGSLLRGNTREDLVQAIIIVDARRVTGVQLAALSDYVAMVALAQINPHAATGDYPTIMNLFVGAQAGARAPSAMTDWDVAFLDGLYEAARNAVTTQQQQRDIARRMISSQGEQS